MTDIQHLRHCVKLLGTFIDYSGTALADVKDTRAKVDLMNMHAVATLSANLTNHIHRLECEAMTQQETE
jgi:hypothetical protein